ncbi:ABC transporter substrate-binding protein [bacterium]|nr:ABC transporter substrate-binding protein [bacterium]
MKKFFGALIIAIFCFSAGLQAKTYQISVSQFVEHPALDAVLKGFQDSLKAQNVDVEYKVHNAQANMGTASQIAKQILGEEPDLILAIATPTAQACAQALQKAPTNLQRTLLFTAVTDPVSAGLVDSWEKPGKNITGVSDMLPIKKHMNMLKTFYPNLKKLGVIYNAGEANSKILVKMIREVGKDEGFQVVEATASKSSEVYQAAKSLVGRAEAVYIPTDNTVVSALESAVKVGTQNNLPIFAADVDSVPRGAVAAMGFDYYKHGYQTGYMAKRILQGADPATTPVETQDELLLHLNLKSAKDMGVDVPQSLIEKADKVVE